MLGQGVLAGDADAPGSLCLFTGLSCLFCQECQPVERRNAASFPQSLPGCGNQSGLREKNRSQYFWRRASSRPLKTCFLLQTKLSPGAGGPQGSAAAAGSWRGPPCCGSGGGHWPRAHSCGAPRSLRSALGCRPAAGPPSPGSPDFRKHC